MRLNLLQQGQTSANNTIVVQVTDTCKCSPSSSPATAQACCTNLTHFNLGYSAFERLAHPDYGLMNLEYRSVLLLCIVVGSFANSALHLHCKHNRMHMLRYALSANFICIYLKFSSNSFAARACLNSQPLLIAHKILMLASLRDRSFLLLQLLTLQQCA